MYMHTIFYQVDWPEIWRFMEVSIMFYILHILCGQIYMYMCTNALVVVPGGGTGLKTEQYNEL